MSFRKLKDKRFEICTLYLNEDKIIERIEASKGFLSIVHSYFYKKSLNEWIDDSDLSKINSIISTSSEIVNFEYQFSLKNGNQVLGQFVKNKQWIVRLFDESSKNEVQQTIEKFLTVSFDPIVIINENSQIINASHVFEPFIGNDLSTSIHSNDITKYNIYLEKAIKNPDQPQDFKVEIQDIHGNIRTVEMIIVNYLQQENQSFLIVAMHDLSLLERKNKKIRMLMEKDSLTNLHHRHALKEQVQPLLNYCENYNEKLGFIIIDIINFSRINNALGNETGDSVLKEVAKRLKKYASQNNFFTARMSGDEFAIVTTSAHKTDQMQGVIKALHSEITRPITISNLTINLEVKSGVAIYPDGGEDYNSLVKNANLALLMAKKENKKNIFYSSKFSVESFKIFEMKKGLKDAIKNEELFLQYQPIIDTVTKNVYAFEALVRWHHPVLGIVSPDSFIPLSEESGLVIPIGEWIFKKCCQMIIDEKLEDHNIKIAYNISPIQFLSPNLVDFIFNTVKENDISPNSIIIEITENQKITNVNSFIKQITQLKQLGFLIALDDFGTGYSSLQRLQEISPDLLKLDRSLIENIHEDESQQKIGQAILSLCKSMSIETVCEGVELLDQQLILEQFESSYLQGYYYHKPISQNKVKSIIANNNVEKVIDNENEEKRVYYRVDFKQPLIAEMTIHKIKGKTVNVGRTSVLIENIGPGGLRFQTTISFPEQSNFILRFQTKILGVELTLFGEIVYLNQVGQYYHYGIQFEVTEDYRADLIALFNRLQVQLRSGKIIKDTNWLEGSKSSFFNQLDNL